MSEATSSQEIFDRSLHEFHFLARHHPHRFAAVVVGLLVWMFAVYLALPIVVTFSASLLFFGLLFFFDWEPALIVSGILVSIPVIFYTINLLEILIRRPYQQVWGVVLERDQKSRLKKVLDSARATLGGPRFDAILLNESFGIYSQRVFPQRVSFSFRDYLVIGLPLLESVTEAEFRAILSHHIICEYVHFHRLSWWLWFARQWSGFQQAALGMSRWRESRFFWAIRWCFRFEPYVEAVLYAIYWEQQYAGDCAAARSTSWEDRLYSALGPDCKNYLIFGPDDRLRNQEYREQPVPPEDLIARFLRLFREKQFRAQDAERWYSVARRRQVKGLATYPSFPQRMRYLQFDEPPPGSAARAELLERLLSMPDPSAAEALLGQYRPELLARLDLNYQEFLRTRWWEDNHTFLEQKRQLRTLEEKEAAVKPLTEDEWWSLCYMSFEHCDARAARHRLLAYLEAHPDANGARLLLGRLALRQGEVEEGLRYLDQLIETDPHTAPAAASWAGFELRKLARYDEADAYAERVDALQTELDCGLEERGRTPGKRDRFKPYTPEVADSSRLIELLAEQKKVKRAYLVEREMKHMTASKYLLLLVERDPIGWAVDVNEVYNTLQAEIAKDPRLPKDCYVMADRREWRAVSRKIRRAARKPLYERAPRSWLGKLAERIRKRLKRGIKS